MFFHFMFLQRLPQSLRTLLGEVEHGDPRALAARANRLWACHGKQQQYEVAAVDTEEEAENVAAIRGQASSGKWQNQKKKKGSKQKKGQQEQQAAKIKTRPTDLACASLTGILERRPGSVSNPVPGRETRPPGVCKRRHPWPSSSPDGRADWQQISSGFWCIFQHHPSSLFSSLFWPSSQGSFGLLNLLLGLHPSVH